VEVTVSARHIDISPALRAAAEDKFGRLSRFGARFERAEVHFVEERNPRIAAREVCEVTVEGRGRSLRARAAAADAFAAIDLALEKLAHQLLNEKTKVVTKRHSVPRGLALSD
jgi:ribosomal subunit interface protein